MSRRKTQSSLLETFISMLAFIIASLLILLFRLLLFFIDLITYFTTNYNQKSDISFLKMYFDKGYYGEFILYRKACRIFGKESVLTNIYLDNKNTDTTEVDVLAVSTKGIYVFEMKNYGGYIFGSEKDTHWTQVFNRRSKNQFYNPLRQNYAHTKAVESYLGVSTDMIVPMVVFSNRSKLSKINVSESQNVFQYKKALRYVRRHEKKGSVVISKQQQNDYIIKLLEKCNMPEEVKQKHINDVIKLQKQSV